MTDLEVRQLDEIVARALLGEGGMGEVYRATDTRLKRDVAIKVLPSAFTADAERLARFEREAQLLAQLNHPNIAAIHGIEESDGVRALVMELVEGPTLADRLEHGRLPLDESLSIARQIGDRRGAGRRGSRRRHREHGTAAAHALDGSPRAVGTPAAPGRCRCRLAGEPCRGAGLR